MRKKKGVGGRGAILGEGFGTMATAAQPSDKDLLVGAHIPLTGEERIVYTQSLLPLGLVFD